MNNLIENGLTHSDKAISILYKFYEKRVIVYVEGDDDITFWDELFKKRGISSKVYTIEQVHGKENLPKYINGIKNGRLKNIIVACDLDYSPYTGNSLYKSPFIITTYGHSIENTMFCPIEIATYIRRLSNTQKDYLPIVKSWYNQFCTNAERLLPYDILISNDEKITNIKCFNDGYCQFLDKASANLDKVKLDNYIKQNDSKFNYQDIEVIKAKIKDDHREMRYIIQGHFIADAVMSFIRLSIKKIKGKTVSLSNDAIYAYFCSCEGNCNPLCDDKKNTYEQIDTAFGLLYK